MTTPEATPRPAPRWVTALLLAAALLPSLPALGTPFLRDAEVVIRDNVALRTVDGTLGALADNYWGDHVDCGLWRPLPLLTWSLQHAVGGLTPDGCTLVDLALHALVVLLLFRWARSLGGSELTALVAALVFAVHPLLSEAVGSHVGRADLLAAAGLLLATLALGGDGRGAVDGRGRLLALAGFAVALLSKENAAAFVPLLVVLALLRPRATEASDTAARRPWLDLALLAGLLAVWIAARWAVLGALGRDPATIEPFINPLAGARTTLLGDVRGVDGPLALAGAFSVLGLALRLFLWPATLSFDYGYDHVPVPRSFAEPAVLFGLVAAVALVAGAWGLRRRAPLAAVGLAWFVVTYAVTGNFVVPIGTIFAERLMYVPALGLCLAVGAGLGAAFDRARGARRTVLVVATAGLLLAAAARTADRHGDWADHDTATAAGAEAAPRSVAMRYGRGRFLALRAGEALATGDVAGALAAWEQALPHLRQAAALCPEHSSTNRALFEVLSGLGRHAEALPALDREVALHPDDPEPLVWRARLHGELGRRARVAGRSDEAERAFTLAGRDVESALARDPDHVDGLRFRAALHRDVLGRPDLAARDLRRVLALQPSHPDRAAIEAEATRLEAMP